MHGDNSLDAAPTPYDVFISYRNQEPDATWVRDFLVPRLRTEGIRVFIDVENFRLGEPVVAEMARAVESSRFTLAVLTPAYLASSFAQLESIFAEHLGLELAHHRLLLLLREPCKPRLGLRVRLWLDMLDAEQVERNLPRLLAALRESGR